MLLLALVIAFADQTPAPVQAYVAPAEVYALPVVRPYEPPSDFGRQIAEGDADATVRTRPITAPVAVEAYADTYEPPRSRREISYEQGVENARLAADARMGPLDGSWRVEGAGGQPVMDIVLSDRGGSAAIEGAWTLSRSDRMGAIAAVVTDGEDRVITASINGSDATLRLRPAQDGWTGTLTGLGPERTVALVRP